ncbi:hypothetical protein [Streptomyces sp. NPDC002588]|uniref:hypothetical protein n=1 Tax=Streptomyces sp. NPDC002588 TaxID=3154419 RepID=UPI003326F0A2
MTSSCHPRWDRNLNTGTPAYDSAESAVARQPIRMGEDYPSRVVIGTLCPFRRTAPPSRSDE